MSGRPVTRRAARTLAAEWRFWVAVWTAAGLAIRIVTVLGRPDRVPGGDAYYYHYAANLLVSGKGFINPFEYYGYFGHAHQAVQTASFPPGFVFVLAAASLVGFKSYFAHRIWCGIVGALAIPVCALVGREIAGRRAGLIAAFLVAVYPNIWMNDELAMSEALSPLMVALVLLAAYRFWKKPGWRTTTWFGLSIGAAAFVRDELALLGLFALVPVVVLTRLGWKRRVGMLALGTASALVVVAPWIGYNMSRFKDPVFISSGLGVTLASANCATTYSGELEAYWSFRCATSVPFKSGTDESQRGAEAQHYALHFIRTHESRIGPVELARLGRGFGFFHPIQQIDLDSSIETRPLRWAFTGLSMYYLFLALSVGGVVALRRRRVPVVPLLAVGLTVVVSMLLTFGNTRYRSPFEVSLVLLSAVALSQIWGRLRPEGPGDARVPGGAVSEAENCGAEPVPVAARNG